MKALPAGIEGVIVLEPRIFEDHRGIVFESHNRRSFAEATGVNLEFVQDNQSRSRKGVLRGIHYQVKHPQGKLVRALRGEVFDVAVDLRRSSPTFKRWVGVTLSEANGRMMWIPPGFGHGVLAMSEGTEVLYKMTDFRCPEGERAILWCDPEIGISWPLQSSPVLSAKDADAPSLRDAEVYP